MQTVPGNSGRDGKGSQEIGKERSRSQKPSGISKGEPFGFGFQVKFVAVNGVFNVVIQIREVLLVQDALTQMGQDNIREDFLNGRNGAATLTLSDLK